MGSSGGTSDPRFLSQGNRPIPGLPIAGQGAPNDVPQNFGQFQEFLPTIQQPGGTAGGYTIPSNAETRLAPSATGLKSEMFQYRSPRGVVSNSGANTGASAGAGTGGVSGADVNDLRAQLAALRSSQPGYGQYGQQSSVAFPMNWTNSNVPNVSS